MVRIGILGIGGFASNHWRALEEVQRSGACRIVATAVIDPANHSARLEELRGQGVAIFNDAEVMFDAMRGKMDAVTIPTPIHTHAPLTIAAVRSGYHVFLEKPAAATIQDFDEMVAAARAAGRLCAVGFQWLHSRSMALLKLRVGEGALGTIDRITCTAGWIRKQEYYQRAAWAGRVRLGDRWVLDGSINNPLAHYLLNMLYLASPRRRTLATPVAVRAELYAGHAIDSEDTAAVEILTREGPRCFFLATLCADQHFNPEVVVHGSEGVAFHSPGRASLRTNDGRIEEPALDDSQLDVAKFENFIAAAEANDPSLLRCSLEMCRPHTLTVNAAFESAGTVRRIGKEFLRIQGEGPSTKTIIDGIDAAIPQAASEAALFSDLELPWAVRTDPFDLTGYDHFPRRFQPPHSSQQDMPGGLPFA